MKHIDLRLFAGENDVFETAYHQVVSKVDMFVVVECLRAFGGKMLEAPCFTHSSLPKVRHIVLDDVPGTNRRERQHALRQSATEWIPGGTGPEDIVCFGDCDEIAHEETWDKAEAILAEHPEVTVAGYLEERQFFANWVPGVVNRRLKFVRGRKFNEQGMHALRWSEDNTVIERAGWHLAYCGGPWPYAVKADRYGRTRPNDALQTWWGHVRNRRAVDGQVINTQGLWPTAINARHHLTETLLYFP